MLITQDQARSVIAKLIYISICGDSTKTASETTELKRQLISFIKTSAMTRKRLSDPGTNLSEWEIGDHFQSIIDLVEIQYFHTLLLIRTGLDIDTLSQTEFKAIQRTSNGNKFYKKLVEFGYDKILFTGTGITTQRDQEREMKDLYRKSRKSFTLSGLINYIKKQNIKSVGGDDPAEFVVNTILEVVAGETGEQTGDDYLKTLGISTMRRVTSSRSILAFFMNEASNSYSKRASLTSDEEGTKAGDWERFKAKTVADLKFAKRKIYDYTRRKMNQLKDISLPLLTMEMEDGISIYDQITDLSFDGGEAEAFLDEYVNKGLNSTKLRTLAKDLSRKLDRDSLQPSDVPSIFGSLFADGMSVNLIRYALANIEAVSSDRSVQRNMRELAYKRIYALGGLSPREIGLLDTEVGGNKAVRGRAKASMKRLVSSRFGLEDLRPMFTLFDKHIGGTELDEENGYSYFVDTDQYPLISDDFWSKVVAPAEKALIRFETLPIQISDKIGIGLQATISEVNGLFGLILKRAKSFGVAESQFDDFVLADVNSDSIDLNHNLGEIDHLRKKMKKALSSKKIVSHPLNSLSSLNYEEVDTSTRASSLHAGNLTNERLSTFSKLKSAMLKTEPYKSDMEDLEAYRLWVQSFSFSAVEAISKIYSGDSGNLLGGKKGPNDEQLEEFAKVVYEDLQPRYNRKPSFNRGGEFNSLKDIVSDISILSKFEKAFQDVVDYSNQDPDDIDRPEMIKRAGVFYDAYKTLSDNFSTTYANGIKAISENSEYADDFATLKQSIVREIALESLSPRSRRGTEKFTSQIKRQRATATAKLSSTALNQAQIIEDVLGKDKGGPVMTEDKIQKAIQKAKDAWVKATQNLKSEVMTKAEVSTFIQSVSGEITEAEIQKKLKELETAGFSTFVVQNVGTYLDEDISITNDEKRELTELLENASSQTEKVSERLTTEVESLLSQGDFLLPEARINALEISDKAKKTLMKSYEKFRDAMALDILTEYPEREALRAKLEAEEKGMAKKEEAEKLLDTLSKKNKTDLTADEQTELAQLKQGLHPLQEESAKLISGTAEAGKIARNRARMEKKEKKQRYSVKVDEIMKQTDLDVEIASQKKIEDAKNILTSRILGDTASTGASLPSPLTYKNQNIARGLASVANAKLLSDKSVAKSVTSAIVKADPSDLLNFLDTSPECFSGVSTNKVQVSLLKGFVKSFKEIGRFYDSNSGSSYTPTFNSPFEDSASGRIANYVSDFVAYIAVCCSIEVAEQTLRNYYEVDNGQIYVKQSAGVFDLYKSVGFYTEAREFLEKNGYNEGVNNLLRGQAGMTEESVKRLGGELRDHIKGLLEDQLDTQIPRSYLRRNLISVEVSGGEEQEPKISANFSIQLGNIGDRRDEISSNYKGFLNGLVLLGGAYLKGGEDVLYESLGLDPDCGNAFASLVELER